MLPLSVYKTKYIKLQNKNLKGESTMEFLDKEHQLRYLNRITQVKILGLTMTILSIRGDAL